MRRLAQVCWLRLLHALDRLRLRVRMAREPGLTVAPGASACLAWARYVLAPGATLRIGPGVVTERRPGALSFYLERGARVEVGEGSWLRTEVGPVHLVAYEDARLTIGPEALLNACHLSAKREVRLGRRVFVGPGSRVFDADQHALDEDRPEVVEPVAIGDFAWIAADVTVLRGVSIGEHSVVGARSVVTRDVPAHTLAFGHPATARGRIGDRSKVP